MSLPLLREFDAGGYPTDYLLARVRGRRAALAVQWAGLRTRGLPAAVTDELIWAALLREFDWLRRQMNRHLRETFDPVCGLFELKTLVLCLRSRTAGRGADVERLLAASQLADALRQVLLREPDVRVAIAAIDAVLGIAPTDAASLQVAYAGAGLKGFETRLTRLYLERLADAPLHPVVRGYFAAFVDLRNLMTLYKQLRWGVDDAAAYLAGGTIDASRLRQVGTSRDTAGLDRLVREVAGREAPPLAVAAGTLETVLLDSLTSELRRIGREDAPVGVVLDHAWRVYIHARNQSVLLHAADLDAATLDQELVA